jgi:aspartate kinase
MKVIKIGGSSLKGKKNMAHILDLITHRGAGHIFVLSALGGVTDFLIQSTATALTDDAKIPAITARLKSRHLLVARHLISRQEVLKDFTRDLIKSLNELERLYYGLNFTRQITPRMQDVISSFGERFSVILLTWAVRGKGIQATYRMPHKIGFITDSEFGDATADLKKTKRGLQRHLKPLLDEGFVLFVPGFFGVSEDGDITTFGRGGSDYSAAVVATAMKAETLEIWKDVAGFMTADPKFVPEAQLIPTLSYEEAAELAYFGAEILHPRTIEPIRSSGLHVAVKNTTDPEAPGSLIKAHSPRPKNIVKSVAHDTDIGILKVHGSGVGARPGILGRVALHLTENNINIKSAVTSQTCISLLLAHKDLEPGRHALSSLRPKPYRRLEKIDDVALVGIVGEGLLRSKGIAARCFSAVAAHNINLEMISFGPSRVALYFLVRKKHLHRAIKAIHTTFFNSP